VREERERDKERGRESQSPYSPPMLVGGKSLFVSRKEEDEAYSRIKLITTQRYEPVDTRASNLDQGSRKCSTNKHQSLYKKQKLEEQSRTRGGKSGGVAGQPQHRRL
jgi:hypothetical protein